MSIFQERDSVVLNYHESLIRESDVELLRGPSWLNDTLISFYFEYLEKDCFANCHTVLFVPPDVTQCIKLCPMEDLKLFLLPLMTHNPKFIYFAFNDNERTDASGGSHWSLVVCSIPEKTVYHFDSSRGSNQYQAREFAIKLFSYFGLDGFSSKFVEAHCLQQSNGYDCGIHLLCNVDITAKHACSSHRIEGYPEVDRFKILAKRNDLLNLIFNLKMSSTNVSTLTF